MTIRVVAREGSLAPSEHLRLREVSGRISRYFLDIVSVEWSLSSEGRNCTAACKVHSRSGYYRAHVASDGFGKAIDQALDKLVRHGGAAKSSVRRRAGERKRIEGQGPRIIPRLQQFLTPDSGEFSDCLPTRLRRLVGASTATPARRMNRDPAHSPRRGALETRSIGALHGLYLLGGC